MPLHRADPDHRRPSWRKLNDFRCDNFGREIGARPVLQGRARHLKRDAHGAHGLIIKLLAI
jgi:hypothetical protein